MEIIVGPYGMQSPHLYRRPHVALYDELVIHAQRAEELGFDGIALTEHSFWYDGYCPSLLPALTAEGVGHLLCRVHLPGRKRLDVINCIRLLASQLHTRMVA